MKKAISVLGLGAVALVASAGVMAQTTDEIGINGLLQAETCKIDTANTTSVVNLDTISQSKVKATVGDGANGKMFSIAISDCSQNEARVTLDFDGTRYNDKGFLTNTAEEAVAAQGVAIALYEKRNNEAKFLKLEDGRTYGENGVRFSDISQGGRAVFDYVVDYIQDGSGTPVTAGKVNSVLKYKIIYQ